MILPLFWFAQSDPSVPMNSFIETPPLKKGKDWQKGEQVEV
jgi:hypothetical protein